MIRLLPLSAPDLEKLVNGDDALDGRIIAEGALSPIWVLSMLRDVAKASSGSDPFVWVIADSDTIIGMLSFTHFVSKAAVVAQDQRHDFGYIVAPQHRGRGIASEAIGALIEIARTRGYELLTAETAPDNKASHRVLIKNGFQPLPLTASPDGGQLISWSLNLRKKPQA